MNDDAGQSSSGGLARPLLLAAVFAAGAAAALATKALLDSRHEEGSHDPDDDLPTVLRRAGLDVAIAATSQAAERLSEPSPQRS